MTRAPFTVKICGITSVRDARVAVEAGADAIGLVFAAESPRRVTLARAAQIARSLPPSVTPVGVFVNEPLACLVRIARTCRLGALQLHGEESPAACRAARRRTGLPVIKAFRLAGPKDVTALRRYRGVVNAILLDAVVPGRRTGFRERRRNHAPCRRGGTGQVVDRVLAVRAGRLGLPVILSGGLRPTTVARAIRQVQPSAVDVSSGVERRPGVKDPAKVRAFCAEARSFASSGESRRFGLTPAAVVLY